MGGTLDSVEDALLVLGSPGDPRWGEAFRYLMKDPATQGLMLKAFREPLDQMGVPPSARDPKTGEPVYSAADVARALGVAEADFDDSPVGAKNSEPGG